MTGDWRVARTFGRNIKLMLSVYALSGFAYFGVQAVLLNLYLLRLGYDTAAIGALIGYGQLVWAGMALPAGAIGRRIGARPALMLWQGLHAIGLMMLLLAETLPLGARTPVVVLGWTVFWVGGSFGGANAPPLLIRSSTPEARNYVFSAQAVVFSVMGFIGSAVAGLLPGWLAGLMGADGNDTAPFRATLWLTPLAHLACVLMLAGIRDTAGDSGATTQLRGAWPVRLLLFWGSVVFLLTASEGVVRSLFNVYLERELHQPTTAIGTVFGLSQAISIVGALGAPALLGRFGARRVVMGATLLSGLALVGLALLPHFAAAAAGFVLVAVLSAIATAARTLLAMSLIQPRWRTMMSAAQTVGMGLGWSIAASAGGWLVSQIGFAGYFLSGTGLAVLAVCLLALHAGRTAGVTPGSADGAAARP